MFYHFEVPVFSGGFVGVDVFFVISGYLITRLIADALSEQRFSYSNFYLRRLRRLIPALLFTIAASLLAGYFLLSPLHLERLGGSALHGVLSISNFFFWGESGYFDADARVKPLLHLWSLSVEEQFYFVWPASLALLLSLTRSTPVILGVIVALGLASLAFAEWCLQVDPVAAFFMLPPRIVEFCVGASLAVLPMPKLRPWILEVLLLAGLGLIFWSVFAYDHDTPFPGLSALVPCLGTALAIFAGQAKWSGLLIRNRLMVFVGLISYSLYLAHWPVFVFYTYGLGISEVGYGDVAILTVASILGATLMYRFVESPFRFPRKTEGKTQSSTGFALACSMLALVIAYPSAHTWANGGWYWRFGDPEKIEELFDLDAHRIATISYNREKIYGASFNPRKTSVLVVGDSHARDVSNGLHLVLPSDGYEVRIQNLDDACFKLLSEAGERLHANNPGATASCVKQLDKYDESRKVELADIVVLSVDYSFETAGYIDHFVAFHERLRGKDDQRLVILDRAVAFKNFHAEAIKQYSAFPDPDPINANALKYASNNWLIRTNDKLRGRLAGLGGVEVISKAELQCDAQRCDFFTPDGDLAVWDANHWTLFGASLFMGRLLERRPEVFESK